MPTHLTGTDGLLIFIGLVLAVALIIKGLAADLEQDDICRDCTECSRRKQQRATDRAEARVQGFIRDGICPKCRWMLRAGHCDMCNKDWR